MYLYLINEDPKWEGRDSYDFNVKYKWELPMVNCSVCKSKWGSSSIAYPSTDLSQLPNLDIFTTQDVVSESTYLLLREQVAPLLPNDALIPPGTYFGPLSGTTYGQHGDFAWHSPAQALFIHPNALAKLLESGVRIPQTVKPEITARGKINFEHLQIQTEAHLQLSERCIIRKRPDCPACGSSGIIKFIEPNYVVKSSIPNNLDLFRMRIRSRYVLVTEKFVDAVNKHQLTNIRFTPVEVVTE
jgi:uncharacterized double-CXXCG motif protein